MSYQNNISSIENNADADIPVAQYVRMSTEHQRYSTENQQLAIAEYAKRHGIRIVRTYADAGKSGLRIDGSGHLGPKIEVKQSLIFSE